MTDVWVIRSDYGKYAGHFVDGCYVAAGCLREIDLSDFETDVNTKDELKEMYRRSHPDHSPQVAGANVGMLWQFLEMEPGDYVITPCSDSQWLYHGCVAALPYYYAPSDRDGCPFPHRRPVAWSGRRINLSEFSQELQEALEFTQKTAFRVKRSEEFISKVTQRVFPTPPYSKDEIGERAKKIYEDEIKETVEPQHNGKFIVIDIESHDFEVHEKMLVASRLLRERRPECVGFGGRVGYKAAYHIGGRRERLQ